MTPWIILVVMASFATGLVSGTFVRRNDEHRRSAAGDLDASGDAPRERNSKRADDLNDPGQTDTAPAGTEQPIPTAAQGRRPGLAGHLLGERYIGLAVVGGIALLGLLGLYASIEGPERASDQSTTSSGGLQAIERLAALTPREQFPTLGQSSSQRRLPSVDEMIERLAARLEQYPNDQEGWRMLGWSYFNTGRYEESAAAYLKAIASRPDFAPFRSLRGEALVKAANGMVTIEAARMFDEALKLDPADPQARFFKGLAKEQAGDRKSALDDWMALLSDADPNEPWFAEFKQRAVELGREIGVDVSGQINSRQAAASGDILKSLTDSKATASPDPVRTGPATDQVRSAQALAPADQTAMIRGMVEGLANRLAQSPRDVDGWIKLIRSRVVLGQADEAKRALDRALTIFEDAPQERSQLAAAARELGLMR